MALHEPAYADLTEPGVASRGLRKAPTGISGLDEVTGGGLPWGRPTLVCGPSGCGMAQSHEIRTFGIGARGLELTDVYRKAG